MSSVLRPMNEAEFEVFFKRSVEEYVETIRREFGVSFEAATQVGKEQTVKLLAQGLKTPNHYCYKIIDTASGSATGDLWIAIVTPFDVKTLFIYQIYIDEKFRGQGHARKALEELNPIAKEHGAERISLNVFDSNTHAKKLYQSLGFATTNMQMQKKVK